MKYCVASIEDNIVRLEGESGADIFVSIEKMPSDIKEGSMLLFDGENYIVDSKATETRKKAVYEKFNRLFMKK